MHCSSGTELDVRSLIIVREKGLYTGICNISLSSLSHKSLTSLGLMESAECELLARFVLILPRYVGGGS